MIFINPELQPNNGMIRKWKSCVRDMEQKP